MVILKDLSFYDIINLLVDNSKELPTLDVTNPKGLITGNTLKGITLDVSNHSKNDCLLVDNSKELSTLDTQGASEERMLIMANKMTYLKKYHDNAISFHQATDKNKEEFYYTRVAGKGKVRAKTMEELIDKLYEYYKEGDIDYSFKGIFELAIKERSETESVKNATIKRIKYEYISFVNEELANMDIRKITPEYIHKYILDKIEEMHLSKKDIMRYKGVLNTVFNYAKDERRRIIDKSPVRPNNAIYKKKSDLVKGESKVIKPKSQCFTQQDIETIKNAVKEKLAKSYNPHYYMIRLSIETGMREGELPSLKWEDIYPDYIHIHSQQNRDYDLNNNDHTNYYYNPSTKNEKGVSKDGRKFPITDEIRCILDELKEHQKKLGIKSEWVFAKRDGTWTNTNAYAHALNKLCKKLGINITNNHGFRKALNSFVFIPKGIDVADRAKLLGHSVEVNLRNYTFAHEEDEFISRFKDVLNG